MRKKIAICSIFMLMIATAVLPASGKIIEDYQTDENDFATNLPFGFIFVFGFSVDVKLVQLEPGEDYVDIEVLNKPFYIWEQEIITINPGAFLRFYNAKGLFLPQLPFCFGTCSDWGIIG